MTIRIRVTDAQQTVRYAARQVTERPATQQSISYLAKALHDLDRAHIACPEHDGVPFGGRR